MLMHHICINVTEWNIGSSWQQYGAPMRQHYKVATSACCHKSVPDLMQWQDLRFVLGSKAPIDTYVKPPQCEVARRIYIGNCATVKCFTINSGDNGQYIPIRKAVLGCKPLS